MDLKTLWNKLTRPTTEAERKMRMKYLVAFPAMFLTTGIILWLIFDSFGDGAATTTNGFNQNMPEPDAQEITADKRDAYAAQKDTVRVTTDTIPHVDSIPQSAEEPEPDMVEASDQAYQQVQASLQDFLYPGGQFRGTGGGVAGSIDELEAQNAMAHQSQQPNEMELMEQSYKLAAQYLGTGNGGQKAVIVDEPEEDRKVMPVNQVNRNVVSSLSASTDNTRSFSTAVGTKLTNFKNTISACVATDQSVTDGQSGEAPDTRTDVDRQLFVAEEHQHRGSGPASE